jgi:hypothetical protein
MMAFKTPDFNERTAAAQAAKQLALDKLRAKPAMDPATVAARQAAAAAREAAEAEKRAARQAALEEAKAAKAAAKAEAAAKAAEQVVTKPQLTAEEQKAIRDARYAARKARKK